MTTIFYENLPIAQLSFEDGWRLDYDPGWEARRLAFPVSLTMPLRSGSVGADRLLPWLANLLPETHLAEIGQRLKVSPRTLSACSAISGAIRQAHCPLALHVKPASTCNLFPTLSSAERILNELPAKPFLVGQHGVSMSLAAFRKSYPSMLTERAGFPFPSREHRPPIF